MTDLDPVILLLTLKKQIEAKRAQIEVVNILGSAMGADTGRGTGIIDGLTWVINMLNTTIQLEN